MQQHFILIPEIFTALILYHSRQRKSELMVRGAIIMRVIVILKEKQLKKLRMFCNMRSAPVH